MTSGLVFRPSAGAMVRGALFVIGAGLCLFLTALGLVTATGATLMILRVAALFPLLITVAALLAFVVVLSRKVELDAVRLVHRQVFKNQTIGLATIRRVELRSGESGHVDTMKIFWDGKTFYLDARAVARFEDLVHELFSRTGQAEWVEVEEFSPASG